MAKCLVSFGANIGDAWGTIQQAAARLSELLCGAADVRLHNERKATFRLSRCYRTPPVGGPAGQPPFVNAVAALSTEASVWDVWHSIRLIEKEFGRERNLRWEARRIDLDILLYDDVRIWTPHLKVPHPRMCMRRFILLPAVDVASDWIDPVSSWTIGQLAENLRSGAGNFVLVAERASKPESLLAEVARQTGAEWRTGERAATKSGRWVSAVSGMQARSQVDSHTESLAGESEFGRRAISFGDLGTKLVIGLAPKISAADVAWEDYHRDLAVAFGLQASDDSLGGFAAGTASGVGAVGSRVDWHGPRYLLASDDRDWAVQELVAALEAMDCPIEPID